MGDRRAILRRIAAALADGEPVEALARLSPRDQHSLLLHLMEMRADRVGPDELLAQVERTPAFAPSFADPRVSLVVQSAAFEAAEGFESIELSPVGPLGAVHALAGIHQNNVLSATRGAELVADPTPVLALECARRRRGDRDKTVRLCTSQRVMRMQPLPPGLGLLPHFRLFALVTAGRTFSETDELREHLRVYLRLFRLLGQRGFALDDILVDVSHVAAMEQRLAEAGVDLPTLRQNVRTHHFADPDELLARHGLTPLRGSAAEVSASLPPALARRIAELGARVVDPLAAEFPEVRARIDLSRLEGLGYYTGPCVRIGARNPEGLSFPLVDGGFTDWMQGLLHDRRERFLSTGIGTDLVCARYRATR